MKNDEIKQANRKALPKFLLFAVVCTIVGGVVGYYSGHSAAKGGLDQLVGTMKEAERSSNAHRSVADAGVGAYRACGLHPDLSKCE